MFRHFCIILRTRGVMVEAPRYKPEGRGFDCRLCY